MWYDPSSACTTDPPHVVEPLASCKPPTLLLKLDIFNSVHSAPPKPAAHTHLLSTHRPAWLQSLGELQPCASASCSQTLASASAAAAAGRLRDTLMLGLSVTLSF